MKTFARTLTTSVIRAALLVTLTLAGLHNKAQAATETWMAYYTSSIRSYTPSRPESESWRAQSLDQIGHSVFWFSSRGRFVYQQYSSDYSTVIDTLTGTCARSGKVITFKLSAVFDYGYSGQTSIKMSGKVTLSGNTGALSLACSGSNISATTMNGGMSYSSASAYKATATVTRFY